MPKVYNKQSEIINDIQLVPHPSTMDSNLRLIKQRIMGSEAPFYQINLGSIFHQFMRWKNLLPRIQPFFAIKCQPDPKIVALLGKLGAGFDCASKQEIKTVVDAMSFNSDQAGTNIIFANPYKFKKDMLYASRVGVTTVTFDTEGELVKLSQEWPSVQLVLRLSPQRVYDATCILGNKFGADYDEVPFLLQRARELSMNVVGVSFHVGSGCKEMDAFPETVAYCAQVMGLARKLGFNPTILDIGGGFPGLSSIGGDIDKQLQFEEMCSKLNHVLDTYFPEKDHYKIIAEPGRYFVYGAYTLVTQVIGIRSLDLTNPISNITNVACHKDPYDSFDHGETSSQGSIAEYRYDSMSDLEMVGCAASDHSGGSDGGCGDSGCSGDIGRKQHHRTPKHNAGGANRLIEKGFRYVINDGVYNSFNCIVFDHAKPVPFGIFNGDGYFRQIAHEDDLYVSTIYGPTCDGFDCIVQQEPLPRMDVGNWIVWPNMGAYTIAAGSCFNGIQMAETHYFMFEEDAIDMEKYLSATTLCKDRFEGMDNRQIIVEVVGGRR